MIKTNELFAEAISLPIDIKTRLMEQLLKSLHPTHKEIDKLWAMEAEKRVKEFKNGKVKMISGEEVFRKIRKRLGA